MDKYSTHNHLKPTSRENANLEAEKGETVVTNLQGDGIPEFYIIDGQKHKKNGPGGTPLNLPDNSFIFSNFKKMRINEEEILKKFNMKPSRKGYTPAEISKKYDFSDFREGLLDPNSTEIEKNTYQKMIQNCILKLGELALYQESLKGFRDGIPLIAQPFLDANGIDPEQFLSAAQEQYPQQEMLQEQMYQEPMPQDMEMPQEYAYGGPVYFEPISDIIPTINDYIERIPVLPKAQEGEEVKTEEKKRLDTEQYKEKTGTYYPTLERLVRFFEDNPEELQELVDIWKSMDFTTSNDYTGKNNSFSLSDRDKSMSTETFLELYTKWINLKAAWRQEFNKNKDKWNSVSSTSAGGKRTINTQEHTNAFIEFARKNGLKLPTEADGKTKSQIDLFNSLFIKKLQSMDQAMQKYVDTKNSDNNWNKAKIYTKNVEGSDPNNKADGMHTTNETGDIMGVSTVDGFIGDKTVDFLPYIELPNDEVTDDKGSKSEGINPQHIDESKIRSGAPYIPYAQDLNNLYGAQRDLMDLRKFLPWEAPLEYEEMIPTFYDYRNDASRMASNNASIMLASGLSADPSQAAVIAGSLAANSAEQNASLQANENNYNVKTANDFEVSNFKERNDYNEKVAKRLNSLYDKNVYVNQKFLNDRKALRKNVRDTYNNLITNASKTQVLNTMHDNYNINPYTGGTMDFNYDENDIFNAQQKASEVNTILATAEKLKGQPGLSAKDRLDLAIKIHKKGASPQDDIYDALENIYTQQTINNPNT